MSGSGNFSKRRYRSRLRLFARLKALRPRGQFEVTDRADRVRVLQAAAVLRAAGEIDFKVRTATKGGRLVAYRL